MKKMKVMSLVAMASICAVIAIGCGNEETNDDADTSASAEAEETEEAEANVDLETIEEQVLLDQDGIKVTALAIINDSTYGKGLSISVENTGDEETTLNLSRLAINNFDLNGSYSVTLAAGEQKEDTIYFNNWILEKGGIENIGKLELHFNLYDMNTSEVGTIFDAVYIETSAIDSMDTTLDSYDDEIYNENGIRICARYDSSDVYNIPIFIENISEQDVDIEPSELIINGESVTPCFASKVYSGHSTFNYMNINGTYEEGEIQSIEIKFIVYVDNDYYETDSYSIAVK